MRNHHRVRKEGGSLRHAAHDGNVKLLSSRLQALARFSDDTGAEADYIVVQMARALLGSDWLPGFVERANHGGIERVLLWP